MIFSASMVALLVAGGGIIAWFGATHYEPLRANHGGVFSMVRVQSGRPTRTESLEPSSYRSLVTFGVAYRNGEWMEYGFTLVSDSAFPVTVEGIGSRESGPPLKLVTISINAPATDPWWGPGPPIEMVAFRPFTLRPHRPRYVQLRLRFYGCSLRQPDEYVTFARELVHFRIDFRLWSGRRSALLPLPYSVNVAGNARCRE
jgi:hypothetical protein